MSTRRGALEFLLARQDDDGLWRDFRTLAGVAEDWPTAYVALALLAAARAPGPAIPTSLGDHAIAAASRAASALVERQRADGGWAYHSSVPTDADSSAMVLLLLLAAPPGIPSVQSCIARGLSRLLAHQQMKSGGVCTYATAPDIAGYLDVPPEVAMSGWCQPHVEVTALSGQVLALAGRRDAAVDAWRFVRDAQASDGGWPAYWWTTPHYATFQSIALGRVIAAPEPGARAADHLLHLQRSDGLWAASASSPPSAFASAQALAALALVETVPPTAPARAVAGLADLQDSDGGWDDGAILRVPPPDVMTPDDAGGRRAGGALVRAHARLFTSAACLLALSLAARRT